MSFLKTNNSNSIIFKNCSFKTAEKILSEFLRKNNRKVKYYKDIIEVEYEYNKYKDNRVKIREIEDILSNLKIK